MAIDIITRLGGRFQYDYKPDGEEVSRRQLERQVALRAGRKPPVYVDQPWAPRWLRNLVGDDFFASVSIVNLSRTRVTDEDLRCLALLPCLRSIYLASVPRVTDNGLSCLDSLHQLEHLDISFNNYKPGGLTDACLVHLRSLHRLRNLNIMNNRFTDDGFRRLETLTGLRLLMVTGTNISNVAIEELKRSAPDCKVY